MCVIAGYIGNEPAAPILLKMLQREEGLAAGFYTGIATVHDSRLHYEKVVGDTETLVKSTSASQLPGTIGMAHGRPPGGGGREFAHPFISQNDELAYIANGRTGKYASVTDDAAHGTDLLRAGHNFKSAHVVPEPHSFPVLSDGSIVHGSDIKCHAIAVAYDRLKNAPHRLRDAMMEIFQRYPSEIVGLCLHASHPDEIAVARHNLPLEIGRDAAGAIYLASTTIAFPEGVEWQMRMPPHAGATLRRNGAIDVLPFTSPKLLPMGDAQSPTAVEKQMCDLLRKYGPLNIPDLFDEVDKLWPNGVLGEKEIVTFETLAALLKEGRVKLEKRRIPGVLEGTTAPRFWVHWIDHTHPFSSESSPQRISVSPESVQIRKATPTDIDVIAQITGEAFGPVSMGRISEEYFDAPLGGISWKEYKSAEVADEARSQKYFFIVAELEGEILGYASWNYDAQRDIATVGHNAVLPKYQGNGIGKKLQQEIAAQLQSNGHTRWKVTTLAHDYPAQRIYEKMGFEEIGRSVVYLRKE